MKEKSFGHTGNEDYNDFLTVIFPDSHLQILAYNRVVKNLNGLSKQEFLDAIGRLVAVGLLGDSLRPFVHPVAL